MLVACHTDSLNHFSFFRFPKDKIHGLETLQVTNYAKMEIHTFNSTHEEDITNRSKMVSQNA